MSSLTKLLIWVAIIGAIFAFAWWKGYVAQIRDYYQATVEELKKCSWPSWDELKGSTVIVGISILLMGIYTFVADVIFTWLVNHIT